MMNETTPVSKHQVQLHLWSVAKMQGIVDNVIGTPVPRYKKYHVWELILVHVTLATAW